MIRHHSDWPSSRQHSLQAPHSTETEHRLTIVEIRVDSVTDNHEKFKDSTTSKILWLERGLQALAYALLSMAFWLAPSKAQGIAEMILGLLKR